MPSEANAATIISAIAELRILLRIFMAPARKKVEPTDCTAKPGRRHNPGGLSIPNHLVRRQGGGIDDDSTQRSTVDTSRTAGPAVSLRRLVEARHGPGPTGGTVRNVRRIPAVHWRLRTARSRGFGAAVVDRDPRIAHASRCRRPADHHDRGHGADPGAAPACRRADAVRDRGAARRRRVWPLT